MFLSTLIAYLSIYAIKPFPKENVHCSKYQIFGGQTFSRLRTMGKGHSILKENSIRLKQLKFFKFLWSNIFQIFLSFSVLLQTKSFSNQRMPDVQTAIMFDINIVNAQFHFKGYLTGNIYNQKAKLSIKMLILNVLTPPSPTHYR